MDPSVCLSAMRHNAEEPVHCAYCMGYVQGRLTLMMGPPGGGKSTLLQLLAGMLAGHAIKVTPPPPHACECSPLTHLSYNSCRPFYQLHHSHFVCEVNSVHTHSVCYWGLAMCFSRGLAMLSIALQAKQPCGFRVVLGFRIC